MSSFAWPETIGRLEGSDEVLRKSLLRSAAASAENGDIPTRRLIHDHDGIVIMMPMPSPELQQRHGNVKIANNRTRSRNNELVIW